MNKMLSATKHTFVIICATLFAEVKVKVECLLNKYKFETVNSRFE
jgi:hypothetical protein